MSNSRASFFRQSAWLAFATVLGGAFMTAVHSVVPLLGTSQYEVFGAMLRLFLLLGIPSAGLQTAFAQQTAAALMPTDRQRLAATSRRVLGAIAGIWLMMLGVTYFGREAISIKLKLGDGLVLWPTLGVGLLWLVLPVLRGLLQGGQDFATLGWVAILDGFLRLSLIIVIVLLAGSTWSNFSFHDLSAFAQRLKSATDPISTHLRTQVSDATRNRLVNWSGTGKIPVELQQLVIKDLNSFLLSPSLWNSDRFSGVTLRPATQELLRRKPTDKDLGRLNRLLLEDAYPNELPPNRFVSREAAAAIAVAFLAMLASTGIALAKTRRIWGGPGAAFAWRPWLARVLPFTLGAGALLLLSNVDLIYLKTIIPQGRADEFLLGQRYQPASMIGFALVQFTVPLAMVMFSKIAHSVAAGGQTDALVLALIGTLVLGSAAAGFVTLFPKLPLQILYFRTPANVAAAPIVPWCAWAMLAFALANVLVSNLLARSRFEIVPWAVGLVFVFLLTLIWLKPHLLGLEPFTAFRRFAQVLGGFNLLLLTIAAWLTWGRRSANA